ncbi:MAG: gamma-glutamyl-gamma-aminobutyrate hydrolase family protein [Eubacteriales bacterium]|nr:gamma-glutamyl-gamma-aminobutyrate hydrolase family protein [Eubacteriales bacterium]
MNVLIAGIPGNTKNYEAALSACHVSFLTSLDPACASSFGRLLLPGGGDLAPSLFGQPDLGSRNVDPGLDRAQLTLLDAFVQAGKPVLGICRGLQLINVYFGGDLIQELSSAASHRQTEGRDQTHLVRSLPGSILHCLFGVSCTVNSAHHQGCGRAGKGLRATQLAPDGVVEGMEHAEKPVLGVQWHPERTSFSLRRPDASGGEALFYYFLSR